MPWLLVTVSTAAASASTRVLVWRRLRGLGAVYLQQAVCLLPDVAVVRNDVDRLLDRVRDEGGSGRLLEVQLRDQREQDQLVGEFQKAADAEYADLLERIPGFLDELVTERARGRATLVEVEENEADLDRYRRWLAKIQARDYFHAPLGPQAQAELDRCSLALEHFERDAFAAETGAPLTPTGSIAASGGVGALAARTEEPS